MGLIEQAFRRFWLAGIQNARSSTVEGVGIWIKRKSYTISSITGRDAFTIQVFDLPQLASGFAQDCTKMAAAAFETMLGMDVTPSLPKSAAWIIIKSYYAAFFASHSLLRMLGLSCLQLDQAHVRALDYVASQSGFASFQGFEAGFYIARYDRASGELNFQKSSAARRGSHEILWDTFSNEIRSISNTLLATTSAYTQLSLELAGIEQMLRQEGQNGGNWLSHVRNATNYRHENGVWFPYVGTQIPADQLVVITQKWRNDAYSLLPIASSPRIKAHVSLCTAIVAICYGVANDMDQTTVRRRSFHSYGCLALTRLAH